MQRNFSFPPVIAALTIAFTLQAMAEKRGDDLESIITKFVFQQMLPQCNDTCCPAHGFYTYSAFISAAKDFPNFGNAGEFDSRKREVAAFFAHTSHQTKEYCIKEDELGEPGPDYCIQSKKWPCSQKKKYYWRGPMHLKWNYNYGPVGESLDLDLLNNPDLVASNATVSFKTAIFTWMTQQSPKPSCHDVMIGNWIPTEIDVSEGRLPGFGVTTNILTHTIDGDVECEFGDNAQQDDRINKYKRFCGLLGVSYGDNLDCNYQPPFSEPNMRLPSKMASFAAAVV